MLLSLPWGHVPGGVHFAPDSGASVFATRFGLHRAQAEEDAAGRGVNGNQSSARPWRQVGFAALSFPSCSGIQLTPSFNGGVHLGNSYVLLPKEPAAQGCHIACCRV